MLVYLVLVFFSIVNKKFEWPGNEEELNWAKWSNSGVFVFWMACMHMHLYSVATGFIKNEGTFQVGLYFNIVFVNRKFNMFKTHCKQLYPELCV